MDFIRPRFSRKMSFYEDLNHIVASEFSEEILLYPKDNPEDELLINGIFETTYLAEDDEGVSVIVQSPRVIASLGNITKGFSREEEVGAEEVETEENVPPIQITNIEEIYQYLNVRREKDSKDYSIKEFSESEGMIILYLSDDLT